MSASAIVTYTGIEFDPCAPSTARIDLRDIAHALANQCRFSGHTSGYLSVAQHSFNVALVLPDKYKAWGLLHDASEAYLGDLASPLKNHSELGDTYRSLEDVLMRAISDRFGLDWPMPECVHEADKRILATEVRDLMPRSGLWDLWLDAEPYDFTVESWAPKDAERTFLWASELLGIK